MEEQINEARYKYADALENGDLTVVGVNKFVEEDEEININIFRHDEGMQAKRIEYVREYKKNRDQAPAKKALQKIYDLTKNRPETNLFEPIMEAVKAKATMQEICDAMREACDFKMPGTRRETILEPCRRRLARAGCRTWLNVLK